jgi:hypothetical protein
MLSIFRKDRVFVFYNVKKSLKNRFFLLLILLSIALNIVHLFHYIFYALSDCVGDTIELCRAKNPYPNAYKFRLS